MTKKEIMKRAWEIKRENEKYIFGECLRMAWKDSKNPLKKYIYIKTWFLNKMEIPSYAIVNEKVQVVGETEKAYKTIMETETIDGEHDLVLNFWVPKKCTMTEEEKMEEEKEQEKRFEEGCKKYEEILNFCKENNVKGARAGLRKETLLKKITESGLKFAC